MMSNKSERLMHLVGLIYLNVIKELFILWKFNFLVLILDVFARVK